MNIRYYRLTALFLFLAFGSGCQTSDQFPQSWGPVAFETPVAFSAPLEIGLDAVSLVHPAESKPGQAKMELTLVHAPVDMIQSLGSIEELRSYMITTFLGFSDTDGATLERSFLGKPVQGWKADVTIPAPGTQYGYLVPLRDGGMLLIALRIALETTKEDATHVLDMIAETLRETNGGAQDLK
jgi:hypothetical protein